MEGWHHAWWAVRLGGSVTGGHPGVGETGPGCSRLLPLFCGLLGSSSKVWVARQA